MVYGFLNDFLVMMTTPKLETSKAFSTILCFLECLILAQSDTSSLCLELPAQHETNLSKPNSTNHNNSNRFPINPKPPLLLLSLALFVVEVMWGTLEFGEKWECDR
ncbi:hypothetical protein Droror1_Dr00008325 [Drosera rotundifolia]